MTPAQRKILDANTFTVSEPMDAPASEIAAAVNRDSFACIRGLFSRGEARAALQSIAKGFSATRDHPAEGEGPGAVMKNFQKLTVGGAGQHWVYNPRFIRVMYNPMWEADIYGMHAMFRKLARLRNRLLDRPLNFAIETIEEGLWTAARLQHYPAGGGFIAPHRDTVISTVNIDSGNRDFHQILLLLTTKGEDYERGGAFVDSHDERIEFEEVLGGGDVAVYNGQSLHGVYDIDPHKRTDFAGSTGRIIAMVSLYKDMSKDEKIYEAYSDKQRVEQF